MGIEAPIWLYYGEENFSSKIFFMSKHWYWPLTNVYATEIEKICKTSQKKRDKSCQFSPIGLELGSQTGARLQHHRVRFHVVWPSWWPWGCQLRPRPTHKHACLSKVAPSDSSGTTSTPMRTTESVGTCQCRQGQALLRLVDLRPPVTWLGSLGEWGPTSNPPTPTLRWRRTS